MTDLDSDSSDFASISDTSSLSTVTITDSSPLTSIFRFRSRSSPPKLHSAPSHQRPASKTRAASPASVIPASQLHIPHIVLVPPTSSFRFLTSNFHFPTNHPKTQPRTTSQPSPKNKMPSRTPSKPPRKMPSTTNLNLPNYDQTPSPSNSLQVHLHVSGALTHRERSPAPSSIASRSRASGSTAPSARIRKFASYEPLRSRIPQATYIAPSTDGQLSALSSDEEAENEAEEQRAYDFVVELERMKDEGEITHERWKELFDEGKMPEKPEEPKTLEDELMRGDVDGEEGDDEAAEGEKGDEVEELRKRMLWDALLAQALLKRAMEGVRKQLKASGAVESDDEEKSVLEQEEEKERDRLRRVKDWEEMMGVRDGSEDGKDDDVAVREGAHEEDRLDRVDEWRTSVEGEYGLRVEVVAGDDDPETTPRGRKTGGRV